MNVQDFVQNIVLPSYTPTIRGKYFVEKYEEQSINCYYENYGQIKTWDASATGTINCSPNQVLMFLLKVSTAFRKNFNKLIKEHNVELIDLGSTTNTLPWYIHTEYKSRSARMNRFYELGLIPNGCIHPVTFAKRQVAVFKSYEVRYGELDTAYKQVYCSTIQPTSYYHITNWIREQQRIAALREQRSQVAVEQLLPYSTSPGAHLRIPEDWGKTNKSDKKFMPLYGIELEIDNRKAGDITKLNTLCDKYAILKSDGSVSNGFELVTIPATLEVHKDRMKSIMEYIKAQDNLQEHETTGLHIHISKDKINFLSLGKILMLLNKQENRTTICEIAGRSQSSYAKFVDIKQVSDAFTENITKERYSALNLVSSKPTYEFRLFKATKDYETLMSRLEFVDALFHYTAPGAVAVPIKEQANISNFFNYVKENKYNYRSFVKINQHLIGV